MVAYSAFINVYVAKYLNGVSKNRMMHIPDKKPCENMNFEEYSKAEGMTISHIYLQF